MGLYGLVVADLPLERGNCYNNPDKVSPAERVGDDDPIVELLRNRDEPLSAVEIATHLRLNDDYVRRLLVTLRAQGLTEVVVRPPTAKVKRPTMTYKLPDQGLDPSVCYGCPIRAWCDAAGETETFGIWGGTRRVEDFALAEPLTASLVA